MFLLPNDTNESSYYTVLPITSNLLITLKTKEDIFLPKYEQTFYKYTYRTSTLFRVQF